MVQSRSNGRNIIVTLLQSYNSAVDLIATKLITIPCSLALSDEIFYSLYILLVHFMVIGLHYKKY
jgi:hypothetical protein